MEVDSPKEGDGEETRIAVHPLAIIHMSDQYTRISCGGSPLDKDAPVVGLLFGCKDVDDVIQIRDADDIPTDVSESSTKQVNLHRAVFPQHSVFGWYRVSLQDEEPTTNDLRITQQLKKHYAPSSPFCFCLLKVQQEVSMKEANNSTMSKEFPINLYELHAVGNSSILLGLSNWELDTSEPERIAVEQVMKEQPRNVDRGASHNLYVMHTKSVQHSLSSMKERVHFLISFLEETQQGKIPPNHGLLRQVQGLVYSLGPLGTAAAVTGEEEDVELLAHLAAVAKTVNAVQSYTDKFRLLHENRTMGKEIRRAF